MRETKPLLHPMHIVLSLLVFLVPGLGRADCIYSRFSVDQIPASYESGQIRQIYSAAGMSSNDTAWAARVIPYLKEKTGYDFELDAWSGVEKSTLSDHLFTAEQLNLIWTTFEILPAQYRQMSSLSVIKRMPDFNAVAEGIAQYDPSGIPNIIYNFNIYPKGFLPPETNQIMIIHELTHALDRQFKLAQGSRFSDRDVWSALFSSGKFVPTENAALEPAEDFADSVAYYVVFPEKLKSISSDKYNEIKKIFGGKEMAGVFSGCF